MSGEGEFLTLDAAILRQWLYYNPNSGRFFWKRRRITGFATQRAYSTWHTRYCGKEAGRSTSSEYCRIVISGRSYLAHRLAWLAVHGHMPEGFIDHIDGDRLNNRINNLRITDRAGNAKNSSHKAGRTGVQNIGFTDGCWVLRARPNGRAVQKKCDSFEDALRKRPAFLASLGFQSNHGAPRNV